MRQVEVYSGGRYAGRLRELSAENYEFSYDKDYLCDESAPPISVNLPKREEPYVSHRIFPFFISLLPEGGLREYLCRTSKVDERDYFGMLEMISGMDCIGGVSLSRSKL